MGYSKKSKSVEGNTEYKSNVDWEAYNAHVLEVINEATEDGEETNQVCFISGIVDSGLQPSLESFTEYDWVDDERQNKLLKADFGCFVNEDTGKFCIPNKSSDSVIFLVDFPSVMINYGKFFSEDGEDDFKPYRTLLAGEWDKIATPTALAPDKNNGYGPKSRINKLAKVTGVHKVGNPPHDFDIGGLLGKPFTMDILAVKNKGFVNIKISNPASKNKAVPVPEHEVEPFGIMWDGGNDADSLKMIKNKKAITRRLEMAENYEGSGLQKELQALQSSNQGGSEGTEEKAPEKVVKAAPAKKETPKSKAPAKKVETEPEDNEDGSDEDLCPF